MTVDLPWPLRVRTCLLDPARATSSRAPVRSSIENWVIAPSFTPPALSTLPRPAGKALFQMLGVFAEFERSIIQERIHAGIAGARLVRTKSGKPIGRAKIAPTKEAAIRAALERGNGIVKTARECQTGTSGAAYQGREGRPA